MLVGLDAQFGDLDRFVQAVKDWDLDFRLLEPNGFAGRVKQLISPDILVSYARFERRLDQAGAIPAGFKTLGIPGSRCREFWWRGHKIKNTDILAFPYGSELRSVSRSDFEVHIVSLRPALLERLAEQMGIADSLILGDGAEVLRVDPSTMQEVRSLAGAIVGSNGGPPAASAAVRLAERLISVGRKPGRYRTPTLRRRDRAIQRVVEHLRSSTEPRTDLAALCEIARVSERTLQYALREHFGLSPVQLVKYWKLNTARRMLLQSGANEDTVGNIAARCGFWHHSQFSADYRRLFAERPIETWRRAHHAG